jgi:hypothetical protein
MHLSDAQKKHKKTNRLREFPEICEKNLIMPIMENVKFSFYVYVCLRVRLSQCQSANTISSALVFIHTPKHTHR